MSNYLGDYGASQTVYYYFNSNDSSGGAVTMTGLALADIKVYKNGSITQRSSTAGFTLLDTDGTDFDGVTGFHGISIDLSDNTDAGFFAAGNDYVVEFDSVTVDAQTVRFNFQFSIENRFGAAYARIGANGAGLTAVPYNSAWDAEIQSEVQDAIEANGLDHLVGAAVVGTDVVDNSIMARLVSASATADWDDFVNTSDSLQAIRDRGDAAWTTGGGGSISDIISWHPLVPSAIDLANTKTWRLGIATTNMLDDLPTTVEITPGTISIDRAAQGGTTWSAVVTDAAMSESDGLIYYDEVFDTATGYASGDVLRITFKGQLVTVSANDYNITPSGGQVFYTGIIADTPDVNVATISGSAPAADALELFALAVNQGTGQLDSGSFSADAITAAAIQDGAFTSGKFANAFLTAAKIATDALTADKAATDLISEIQGGLATQADIAGLNDISAAQVNAEVVQVIANDTAAELASVPAANAPLKDKITWLAMLARNKITQTSTTQTLRNDADAANVATSAVSDDGTTFTRGEYT